jgi:hypothetical protein
MTCDHCGELLHRDANDWYVGADNTSDCPANEDGHELNGQPR